MAKIFISHSSKDKAIVDLFKNIILNAGLGISDNDIAYTSSPETGVPTGGNIPQYIKDNIADSDFVFFMISENYRKSEVCLNEMGAAWALDKNIKPLLLHNVAFESVGWLYRMNLCAKIDDADRLDELRDEFLEKYDSCPKTVVWNRQKQEFVTAILTQNVCQEALPIVASSNDEELGLLDYREAFDANLQMVVQIIGALTNEMNQWTAKTGVRIKQLSLINNRMPNVSQVMGIMKGSAIDMNRMSEAIDENATKLLEHFKIAVENAIGMYKCIDPATDQNIKEENRKALAELIQAQISARDQTIQCKNAFFDMPNMEKTQIVAKKRLMDSFSALIAVYDECITKATELLKA